MATRASAPKRKPTSDLGWERGHTGGIEDRRTKPHLGPPTPWAHWPDQTGGRPPPTVQYSPPRAPRGRVVTPAPSATPTPGTSRTRPKPVLKPVGTGGPRPKVGYQTPQATTGKGVQSKDAYRTPQATTGQDVRPLVTPKPAKPKVRVHPQSPVGRSIAKNTGKNAGRRKS